MRHPLSLEAFADWCEKQPDEAGYDYWSRNCALIQYAHSLRMGDPYDHSDGGIQSGVLSVSNFWGAADILAAQKPLTFGALASRLRASIQEA